MYRATRLNNVLIEIANAYAYNADALNDTALWSRVEGALNLPDGSLGRRTVQQMADDLWRNDNSEASIEREKRNS